MRTLRAALLTATALVLLPLVPAAGASRSSAPRALEFSALGITMPVTLVPSERRGDEALVVFLPGSPNLGDPLQQARSLGLVGGDLRAHVAVLDTGPQRVCDDCGWVDGPAGGTPFATFLQDVVVPGIRDASGSGSTRDALALVGSGSGGTGALLTAFDRSDLVGAVAAAGPVLDLVSGLPAAARQRLLLAEQGYEPGTAEATLRDLDPREVASQAVGTGLDVSVAVAGTDVDLAVAQTADAVSAQWSQLGLAHLLFRGAAGESEAEVFRRSALGRLGRALALPRPTPREVSLRSSRRALGSWGWDFQVVRDNEELFTATGARVDGSGVVVAGSGAVTVTTPPVHQPGSRHTVVVTRDPASDDARPAGVLMNPLVRDVRQVVADRQGRLSVGVTLGPARAGNQTRAESRLGRWPMQHVRVEVDPRAAQVADATGPPTGALYTEPRGLPAPFDRWGVEVSPGTFGNPTRSSQILSVRFPSRVLGALRGATSVPTETYVFLPDAYLTSRRPLPVLYFLHGTGSGHNNLAFGPQRFLASAGFVVVVPDMGLASPSFCKACDWVDARQMDTTDAPNAFPVAYNTATEVASLVDPQASSTSNAQEPVMAERHLYEELLPLMEAMFRIRDDRNGRAIDGDSMGAGGALIQAFRHPDRFRFVGALSGTLTVSDPTTETGALSWFSYLSNQGYPVTPQRQILFRGISVDETATNAVGSGLTTLVTNGDGCEDGTGYCSTPPVVFNTEAAMRRSNDPIATQWVEQGVPFSYMTYHGEHYRPDVETYPRWHLPLVAQAFAEPVAPPDTFSYKSIDPTLSVWGYDVSVTRPNVEFLSLNGARLDGTEFTVHGTGSAVVTTPRAFRPGETRLVTTTRSDGTTATERLAADAQGRLSVRVALGGERLGDEQRVLLERGAWPVNQVHVAVEAPQPR